MRWCVWARRRATLASSPPRSGGPRSTVPRVLRVLISATLLCLGSCACEEPIASPPSPGPVRPTGPGPGPAPTPTPDAGSSDGGNPDGGPCPMSCSDDLRSRIDCNGARTACPTGLGCTPAGCIDACTAAVTGGSTLGCQFFVAPVPPQFETRGSCYAAFVANTWSTPVAITVKREGVTLDVARFARRPRQLGGSLTYESLPTSGLLAAGEMAILFLSEGSTADAGRYHTPCPVPAAFAQDLQLDGTGVMPSFEVTTTAPVVAYDIYPYGGALSHVTSASLLIPTSGWGTNYVGVTPASALSSYHPYLQLYGQADGTRVAIEAPVAIVGGANVPSTARGAVGHYLLNRGEVLQLAQPEELSGALVRSDKPIAVWGGHACMNIPLGVAACDSAHQQLPAVPLLSHEYVGVRYPARGTLGDVPRWRLVGAVDQTRLTWQPPVSGAPSTLAARETVEFEALGPFRVTSQDGAHVFYASQLMGGGQRTGGEGDPEFVNLVPPQQFLRSYLFFTDPTYAKTSLVFIRQKGADGRYADVMLDCKGAISGWSPIGTTGYQAATATWLEDSSTCHNGVHEAHSAGPFGLTVWGTDAYTSYAWPAGMGVRAINGVVVGPQVD